MSEEEVEYSRFEFQDRATVDFERIMFLINSNLSEPYSIYVYRFFINNWPNLCHIVRVKQSKEIIGVIISKIESHRAKKIRGYIGMLTVDPAYRSNGLAKKLIELNIDDMIGENCDEIMLETEVVNENLLRLYENFGFIRVKRLYRYYLNTHDAFRLILPLSEKSVQRSTFLNELNVGETPKVIY